MAADEGMSAITAGTLTNLAAVLPFLLMTGLATLIFTRLLITISFAVVASLAVALTLIPMLAAQFAKIRFESGFNRLARRSASTASSNGCPTLSARAARSCCAGAGS